MVLLNSAPFWGTIFEMLTTGCWILDIRYWTYTSEILITPTIPRGGK